MNAVGNSSDENFLVLLNAHHEDVGFTLPAFRPVQELMQMPPLCTSSPYLKSFEC
jgi:hypothetical protein